MLLFDKINQSAAKAEPFLFFVDYELKHYYFTTRPLDCSKVFWQMSGVGNAHKAPQNYTPGTTFSPQKQGIDSYASKFKRIDDALHRGDSFLANLTISTPIETDFSLNEIFHRSQSRYRLLVPDRFVCFSPETFVRIEDDKILTYPMKGTISGLVPDAAATILADYKETCEHNTIVDFLRSDLARVATDVQVSRFRYIDTLHTSHGPVLQVSSEVVAQLPPQWRPNLGNILRQILPAGSICGAPRIATVKAIAQAEGEPRGFYTGIMGYFDGRNFDSAVLIRYIETPQLAADLGWQHRTDNLYRFRSGGGITINSNMAEEYNEVHEKVYLPFDM